MSWLRWLAMLPLLGLVLLLGALGRVFQPLSPGPAPAVWVSPDSIHVQPGTLGQPRHVRQQVAMALIIAVVVVGTMTADLAAAGGGSPLVWIGFVATGLFALGLPGCQRWIRFETHEESRQQ
jgi:hypothetical protein